MRTSENSVKAKFGEGPGPDGSLSSTRDPHIGEYHTLAHMGIGSDEALGRIVASRSEGPEPPD
jgi:hypothetical protein